MATHRDVPNNGCPGAMIARTHTTAGGALTKGGRTLGVEPLLTPGRVSVVPRQPPKRGWRRLFG